MSYDALMRWEWEGGAPAFAAERDDPAGAESAESAIPRPTRANRQSQVRQVATGSPLPSEGTESDGSER